MDEQNFLQVFQTMADDVRGSLLTNTGNVAALRESVLAFSMRVREVRKSCISTPRNLVVH
jgi:hypothetical protein